MSAWFLALLVLIISCGVGAYYVGGHWTGLEGFADASVSSSGGTSTYLKKVAERKCESDYQACMNASGAKNAECTKTYNTCNAAAQKLDTTVSTVSNDVSTKTQFSSAAAALAYAKAQDPSLLGKGDAVAWAKSGDMLKTQYHGSTNPDSKFLEALRQKMLKGYVPTAQDVKAAQGTDFFEKIEDEGGELWDKVSSYISLKKMIKPHETPAATHPGVKAKTHAKRGNDDDDDDDDEDDSLRKQIRRDVEEAVHAEFDELENEYEVKYD